MLRLKPFNTIFRWNFQRLNFWKHFDTRTAQSMLLNWALHEAQLNWFKMIDHIRCCYDICLGGKWRYHWMVQHLYLSVSNFLHSDFQGLIECVFVSPKISLKINSEIHWETWSEQRTASCMLELECSMCRWLWCVCNEYHKWQWNWHEKGQKPIYEEISWVAICFI